MTTIQDQIRSLCRELSAQGDESPSDAGVRVASLIDALEQRMAEQVAYIQQLEDANTPEPVALREQVAALTNERDIAIGMLAEWCVAVHTNGPGWDDWDEYYKNAMYRPNPLRELLDAAIAAQKETP